ncbi:DNA polymerase III subunit gamma and tau [Actinoplanes solisilvae]|uniref:DNA polymerase III subunit gamma and tau n=1 Tax=Actinoplanes solisilvae TaxID=2486853 RepID=UPI000FDAC7D6|nr:DNA polymerase III subunit gamma and tau [Actinoplanes solisilvae]
MALALYRKYRPRTFAEIIGQEHVTEPLSQALRSGRLHHAYLFSGPRGCGKTSSARILARSLNCEQGPTPEPCGVCGSCRSLANDGAGSIDVIEIDAASHGGVDDARELREKAFFAPASSRYKIYVIDEAHMVSSAGFNALLKLVEEPPDYVKFIFATTEPEKVLGTIRSRTHHYPFRLIPPATLRPYLQQLTEAEGVQVEPAVFPLVVRAGGGSARDTLSVLDQLIAGAGPDGVSYARAVSLLGVTDVTLLDEMCDALAAGDGAAAYSTIDRVAEAGHDPRRFASDLLERFRDLIVLQQVPDAVAKGLIDGPADQLETMGAQAARLGPATLSRCADIVHNGLVEMRGTTAPRLLLELVTARMLLPGAEDSTGSLLQRLERMERRLALGGEPLALPEAAAPPAAGGVVTPVAAGPAPADPAPVASAAAVDGVGRSAARAAAAAAARRGGVSGGAARPTAAQTAAAAPVSAIPVSAAPDSATPVSAAAVSAAPVSAAPVSAAPVSAAPVSAAPVSAAPSAAPAGSVPAAAEPDWNDVADGTPADRGGPATGVDDDPPWDDEPDFDSPSNERAEAVEPVAQAAPVAAPAVPAAPSEPSESVAPARRAEPVGVLPDAPEEPGAAAVEAVAAGPGQLTAHAVRQVWPEVLAEVKKQPRGVVLRAMAADATVRELEGETVVLTVPSPRHAQGITQGAALIVNALYEVLGGQWSVRCEIAGAAGATSYGSAPQGGSGRDGGGRSQARGQTAPGQRQDAGGQRPAPAAVRAGAAPAGSAQPAGQPAAAARAPHTQRRQAETPASGGDDEWPEPARPGGPSVSTASQAPAVEEDDGGWPEVRVIPVSDPTAGEDASDQAEPSAPAERDSGAAATDGALPTGPAAGSAEYGESGPAGQAAGARPGSDIAAGGEAFATDGGLEETSTAGSDAISGASARRDSSAEIGAGPGGGAGPTGSAGPSAAAGVGPAAVAAGGDVSSGGSAALAAARAAAARASAGNASRAAAAAAPQAGAATSPAAAGGGSASAGRASGPGSGLAAARAAAAGARAGAGTRQTAKPADEAWADGSPAEEAPYDPEFDGPPGRGAKYEGFDPGDEPLDDVIDEKTARESSEQQAMRLLQEAFGAEKIGES